jgi:hypothetical protein
MKTEEIQERNVQIALMLGWIPYEGLNPRWRNSFETNGNSEIFNKVVETLKFHSDWKWLMEAVDFIEDLSIIASVHIERQTCYIWKSSEDSNFESIEITAQSKQEATFIAVSDFAKLYNEEELS